MDSLVHLQKKILDASIKFKIPDQIIEQLRLSHQMLSNYVKNEEHKNQDKITCDICCCENLTIGQKQCLNKCKLDICQMCQSKVTRCAYCRCEYGCIIENQDELHLLQIGDIDTVRQRYREIYRNQSGDPNSYQKKYKSTNIEINVQQHYNYEDSPQIKDGVHLASKLRLHENNDPNLQIIDSRRLLINVKQNDKIVRNILVDYRDINSLQIMDYETVNKVLFKNVTNLYKEFTKDANIKFVNKFGKREITLYTTTEFSAIWYLNQFNNTYMLIFKNKNNVQSQSSSDFI